MTIIDPRCPWVKRTPCASVPRWELKSLVYQDENESGGRHNLYVTVLDKNGAPMSGVRVWQDWGEERVAQITLGGVTDFGLYGGPFYPDQGQAGAYSCYVESKEASDVVSGMGLPANRHVNYIATFQRVEGETVPPVPVDSMVLTRLARALRVAAEDLERPM